MITDTHRNRMILEIFGGWFCIIASFACLVFGSWLTAQYMLDPYARGSIVFASFLASLGASFAFVHFITRE